MTLHLHVAEGSANRKLTGLALTKKGNARRNARVWVINPVGFGAENAETPRKGRTYELCPLECIHLPARFGGTADADCYADGPVLWTADRVNGIPADVTLRKVREAIADGRCEAIRWAVVGDLGRTVGERAITRTFLRALRSIAEAAGVPVITYTHAWHGERAHSPAANASCDTIAEVAEARALGYQPVYVAQDEAEAKQVIAEVGGFVCPEMAGRASGCFGGDSPCAKGKPLCARERSGSTMVLLAH